MPQYTDSQTTSTGIVVNAVLNTETNQITYTVTAPNGAVATSTQSADVSGNSTSNIQQLFAQLQAAGFTGGPARVATALAEVSNNVTADATKAAAESTATKTPVPQETQPIPASTVADPGVPQPTSQTAPQQTQATPVSGTTDPTAQTTLDQQLANLRAAEIAANGGVDPNAVTDPAIQAQIDKLAALNAKQEQLRNNPGAVQETELTQAQQLANLRAAEIAANGGVDPNSVANPQPVNPDESPAETARLARQNAAADTTPNQSESETARLARQEAAVKQKAQEQATLNARYRTSANNDWRVRLSLAPSSDYLYNASPPGILAPLAKSKGVIFPYTPTISTVYSANYEAYDLIHSNYRGLYYKNSKVGDISVRGTFTAQDTFEANYLLAVIHFFRSVTKMFYGQDPERGTPPPLVYLSGFGEFQFNGHPCVVSSFTYTLPNDVDYIKANNPNNYGTSLFNRRQPVESGWGGVSLGSAAKRLANALLPKGAQPETPAPRNVAQTVNNTMDSTYVPTKMEIDITLIPVQTRSQVSKVFSLKNFANGQGLKGGFW